MPHLSTSQIRDVIFKQLPNIIKKDEEVKKYITHLVENIAAPKKQTQDRFERMMAAVERSNDELQAMREDSERKWVANEQRWKEWIAKSEQTQKEWNEKWEANDKRWKQNQDDIRINQEDITKNQEDISILFLKFDQGVGAIGERWGFHAEGTFRNAFNAMLRKIAPDYKVEHSDDIDLEEYVLGEPSNIEIDLIIRNGKTYLGEIKASMSKGDMVYFKRKAEWWEKKKNMKAEAWFVISPMIHNKALEAAKHYGIRCFSYAENLRFD